MNMDSVACILLLLSVMLAKEFYATDGNQETLKFAPVLVYHFWYTIWYLANLRLFKEMVFKPTALRTAKTLLSFLAILSAVGLNCILWS